MDKEKILNWGKETLEIERASLSEALEVLGEGFLEAVEYLLKTDGKVVVTGLGKSGHVARKISSTLASTGSPSFYIHPTEALHGDFGMIASEDVLVAITFGGETREVLSVVKFAKERGIPVVALTGRRKSSLAKLSDALIEVKIKDEADGLGLAPTSSSTVTLALGDALAVSTLKAKNFSKEEFASLHPGGSLGKRLFKVSEIMETVAEFDSISPSTPMKELYEALSNNNNGIAAVTDEKGILLGAFSDGDLRRLVSEGRLQDVREVREIMSTKPKFITETQGVDAAISLMETHGITRVFVVSNEDEKRLTGIVRLSDLLSASVI